MSELPGAAASTLSPDELKHVDHLCDRFEESWRSGVRPDLKAWVEELGTPVGKALLCELLNIELAYRMQHGEQPTAKEYQALFPGQADLIDAAFAAAATQPPSEAERQELSSPTAITNAPPAVSTQSPAKGSAGAADGHWPGIPGYEILGELGRGAMGIVYQARQHRAERLVALKVIRDGFLAGPDHRRRFKTEAEAAAQFQHPNLIRIYEVGEHQGLMYFSMEWGEGGSLDKKLAGRPMPAREAATLARTLAEAVHYAHDMRIIHRDLKPGNIVLTGDGRPLITDFGLAKRLDSESHPTLSHQVMGTAAYMPPEQARGDSRSVGPAADVYSLGAILYELITGQPPFRAKTWQAVVQLVVQQEPLPPGRLQADVPPDLEAICLKCLEKEPEQRYGSARALADDLGHFLAGEPPSITPLTEWDRQSRWALRAGFELLDMLGGSRYFGLVYKARQLRLNRTVVLKTVVTRAFPNPLEMARLGREGQTLAQLQHPNIVQVYDLGEHEGQAYMATEFVEGGTLAEKLLEAPWPARQAVALVAVLARAVHYAHQRGIVHRALRPFSILLTTENVPKITNFGLDRLLEAEPPTPRPRRPSAHHLTNYMAPEQVDGPSASVGPAADIYALGAILYELLTGRVPIAADDVAEFLRRVRTEPALPPSDWRADLPRNLDAICLKCLTKLPADRYPSAEALAEALQRFSAGDQQKTEEVQLVPGYAFEEELGRGGLGVVHKARQLSLDRLVALKVFHAAVPAPVQRHVRAANRAMARLHHPNLLQVYDCGERDGLLYVAEEFVDGVRLDQKCAGIPRPPDEAAGLIETLAKAMDFAHRHGVIHCNLKPQVVLVSAEGMPKISSFEVARLLGQPDAEAGGAGANVVSPLYMAPEQAGGNTHAVGPATDVYGLGNILYEMLTGRAPFAGVAFGELLDRLRFQMPDPPRRVQCSVPEGLEAICLKCLQKLPEQRYASAAHLADDLSRFLRGVPSAGPAPASLAPGAGDETGPRTDTVGKSHPGIWSRLVQWFRWRPRRKN